MPFNTLVLKLQTNPLTRGYQPTLAILCALKVLLPKLAHSQVQTAVKTLSFMLLTLHRRRYLVCSHALSFIPFRIALTSIEEERTSLGGFRIFVRFALILEQQGGISYVFVG